MHVTDATGQTMAKNAAQWDNSQMHKPFTTAANLLAVGTLLLGISQAQQTPAATTQTAPAAKSQKAATPAQEPPAAKAPAAKATPAAKTPLTTTKEKFSYAIGTDLGNGLKKQSVEVDADRLSHRLREP